MELGEIANDCDALEAAIREAMAVEDRPSLLRLRSHIGYPSPDHTDDHEAHGLAFDGRGRQPDQGRHGDPRRAVLGPRRRRRRVPVARRGAGRRGPPGVGEAAGRLGRRPSSVGCGVGGHWGAGLGGRPSRPSSRARRWPPARPCRRCSLPARTRSPGWWRGRPTSPATPAPSSRAPCASRLSTPSGRQIYFGIREHGMGAALVGHGRATAASIPVGGTFFVFSDYARPTLRLAALSRAKAVFVFSHDSVGVGEDGPTHQPVEHLAALRAIPGLQVIRPADANETGGRVAGRGGPRRSHRARPEPPRPAGRHRRLGGRARCRGRRAPRPACHRSCSSPPAARSACASRRPSGSRPRASLPRVGVAARRGTASRRSRPTTADSVLPPGVPVLSVEAAATFGWARWADESIGIDRFGASAPGVGRAGEAGHQRRPRRGTGPRPRRVGRQARRSMMDDRLIRLYEEHGQSPWLDNLTRGYITSGQLAALRDRGIRGLTSNPTIFQKAIEGSPDYDEQFRTLASADGTAVLDDYWALVLQDIRSALEVFAPVYESSAGGDGFVSVEVDPGLAHDTDGTVAAARHLHEHHRPPEPVREDPGDGGGRARHPADDQRGAVHQRHVDLQPRALLRGDGGLHQRAGGVRGRPGSRRQRGQLLHQPRGHRGRSAPGGHRQPGSPGPPRSGGGRPGEAGLPAASGPRSAGRAGTRWLPGVLASSGRCGRPPRPRTRPTRTRSTSTRSSAPTRSTPCRAPPSRPSSIMARWRGRSTPTSIGPRRCGPAWPRSAWTWTTSPRCSSARACSSFQKSFDELLDALEAKAHDVAS